MRTTVVTLIGPQTNEAKSIKSEPNKSEPNKSELSKPTVKPNQQPKSQNSLKANAANGKTESVTPKQITKTEKSTLKEVSKEDRLNLLETLIKDSVLTPEDLEREALKAGYTWKANSIKQYLKPPTYEKVVENNLTKFRRSK